MSTLIDVAKEKGPALNVQSTGFVENWGASLGQTIDEDLSISEYLNSGAFRDRNSELLELIREGQIPTSAIYHRDHKDFNGGINYDEAAKYANSMLDGKYQTDEEINLNIRESLQERRTLAEGIHKDAGVMGKVGQFTGALHGFAIDPINASTMFLGAGMASRSVLSLAGREAAIAGVSEAAIQPFVLSWKKDIGADYSAKDAVANIVMATGMGGTIGALTAGISKLLRKKPVTKEEKTAYQAAEYLQNELKEAPDVKMDAGEFLENIERTTKEINNDLWHGSPHRFSEFKHSQMGTGEGAQTYGWGTYLAEAKEVGVEYKKNLSDDGYLYNVRVSDDKKAGMLDWDKPLLEQSEVIRKRFIPKSRDEYLKTLSPKAKKIAETMLNDRPDNLVNGTHEANWDKLYKLEPGIDHNKIHDINTDMESVGYGMDIVKSVRDSFAYGDKWAMKSAEKMGYDVYGAEFGSIDPEQLTSEYLKSIGVPGVKYFDAKSRGKGAGTRNYVIFDEADMTITGRNGDIIPAPEAKTTTIDNEVDLKFDTLSKENPDMPTILSHEKDMKGDTIINYGRATDEVKKIEAQELDLESIRGCLIGG